MLGRLGLQKTTLVDVPGYVAATVFTHGCPLRCPYCHNAQLQRGPAPADFASRSEVLAYLRRRASVLEAVCVTGGEPCVHPDLEGLLQEIASLGLLVKLDTSGVAPRALERLLDSGLIDMVAMDLKTSWNRYPDLGGDPDAVRDSLAILRRSGRPYELRTTLAPAIVQQSDLTDMARELLPHERWVWAQFAKPDPTVNPEPQPEPYARADIQRWAAEVSSQHKNTFLRAEIAKAG